MQNEKERPREGSGMAETLSRVDPDQIVAAAATFAREHPHTAIAAAAGIGFLLGGGLTPRLLGSLGVLAARHYLRESLRDVLPI